MPELIREDEGRVLFGTDPANYAAIRPPYPEQIYQFLHATGAIRSPLATLEIGAGSGLATQRLLELGANPLTVLEPDVRFAPHLRALVVASTVAFEVLHTSFEAAALPAQAYDLVVAATSFHWIRAPVRLAKAACVLKPQGYLALWWNVFGDPQRADPFHDATRAILAPLASSPSGHPDALPFALDRDARHKELVESGGFEEPQVAAYHWTLRLTTQQVGALYATFSPISRLSPDHRARILNQLMEVAEREFGGVVERNMISPIYVSRRRPIAP